MLLWNILFIYANYFVLSYSIDRGSTFSYYYDYQHHEHRDFYERYGHVDPCHWHHPWQCCDMITNYMCVSFSDVLLQQCTLYHVYGTRLSVENINCLCVYVNICLTHAANRRWFKFKALSLAKSEISTHTKYRRNTNTFAICDPRQIGRNSFFLRILCVLHLFRCNSTFTLS